MSRLPSLFRNIFRVPIVGTIGFVGGVEFGRRFEMWRMRQVNNHVYIVKGQDEGKDAWCFVLVDDAKLSQFRRDLGTVDKMELLHYGEILESGYGQEPPDIVTKSIKKKYGIKI